MLSMSGGWYIATPWEESGYRILFHWETTHEHKSFEWFSWVPLVSSWDKDSLGDLRLKSQRWGYAWDLFPKTLHFSIGLMIKFDATCFQWEVGCSHKATSHGRCLRGHCFPLLTHLNFLPEALSIEYPYPMGYVCLFSDSQFIPLSFSPF